MQKLKLMWFYSKSVLHLNRKSTYISVYVDNLHIIILNLPYILKLKEKLASKFKKTRFEPTFHHLGMEVSHNKNIITVNQTVPIDHFLIWY